MKGIDRIDLIDNTSRLYWEIPDDRSLFDAWGKIVEVNNLDKGIVVKKCKSFKRCKRFPEKIYSGLLTENMAILFEKKQWYDPVLPVYASQNCFDELLIHNYLMPLLAIIYINIIPVISPGRVILSGKQDCLRINVAGVI